MVNYYLRVGLIIDRIINKQFKCHGEIMNNIPPTNSKQQSLIIDTPAIGKDINKIVGGDMHEIGWVCKIFIWQSKGKYRTFRKT